MTDWNIFSYLLNGKIINFVISLWLLKKELLFEWNKIERSCSSKNEIIRNCKSVGKLLAGSVGNEKGNDTWMHVRWKNASKRTRKWWARWGMNGGMSTLSATGVQVLFAGTVSRKAHRIQSLDNFRKCYPSSILSIYFSSYFLPLNINNI